MKNSVVVILLALLVTSCRKDAIDTSPTLPAVSTTPISSITSSSAISGGSINFDGEASVTARGICYGTSSKPTLANNSVAAGSGNGNFTCNITNLQPNTTYYVRAYATNSVGTAYGNNEVVFTTLSSVPSLSTSSAFSINGNEAQCGGVISATGGLEVLVRGVCFGKSPNPTINDSISVSSSITDSFTVLLPGLEANTTYYARAFATTATGTGYGPEISFTTATQVIAIGEMYNGGIIFYVDDSGVHGLIVAPTDQSTSADWGCNGTLINGADGTNVGFGQQNTLDILTGCSSVTNAAAICANLTLNGYNDWYLPSKDELTYLYNSLNPLSLGNFSAYNYWSSSEIDAGKAYGFNFSTNTHNSANKNSPYSVRAIRSF